ncbi:GNAT family N-acetyltransferase [Myxococcus llanfairpwllgwyngyllgogerychwyrndrobwllllantysiliogogogochensis]|uniref:GNAT family N-acetyltransferase n=1 Tax=Myxococcus llanfairpwllgwyngyllgogerychwyrndrobwllllantysiliogogogochensis TaxID=2590453 RepID=A0A540WZE1_9BACT|nr:GNAT family N-acetyltransferase [Myxococcus llanfairpwllgwyngyllgogerychwyrndrobwllllantysiliogogogochensis]TQF14398.1 GNAT family N-acetyltransferase [Myxococcus llanfairpwllgwyngyllgogerychwyrndrobwllllantysiliogogogochensis]
MSLPLRIECGPCVLRPWRRGDEASLVQHANNREVWRNLRDRFPHPYTAEDAAGWVSYAGAVLPPTDFAIEVDGAAVGSMGLIPGKDVERYSAEVGYWLGQSLWGRGIASSALDAFSSWTFANTDLLRLFALPFADNVASCRVLEKAGFQREGLLRRSAVKDGTVHDQALYARLRPMGP